jgi:hypothetical protein
VIDRQRPLWLDGLAQAISAQNAPPSGVEAEQIPAIFLPPGSHR